MVRDGAAPAEGGRRGRQQAGMLFMRPQESRINNLNDTYPCGMTV